MTALAFLKDFPRAGTEHPAFSKSPLWPTAPEYTTGEVIVGGAYRRLLLGVRDSQVDLEKIDELSHDHRLGDGTLWGDLLSRQDGLASPEPRGRRQGDRLRQLMPLVPEIARHACVLGRVRNRWEPGNLLLAVVAAGGGPDNASTAGEQLRGALSVQASDDILARYIEQSLAQLTGGNPMEGLDFASLPLAPWRTPSSRLTPAERFVLDIPALAELKGQLTRRQWIVLVEASLRLALGLHVLWLLRLNWEIWLLTRGAVEDGREATAQEVERAWEHHFEEAMLTVGADASTPLRRSTRQFVHARMGMNLVLHALEDSGSPWNEPIAAAAPESPPQASVMRFLEHTVRNRDSVRRHFESMGFGSLSAALAAAADRRTSLAEAKVSFAKNTLEFLRYSLGQLQPDSHDLAAYDQSYLLRRRTTAPNSTLLVVPSSAVLLYMVHACSIAMGTRAPSVDLFREFARSYGLQIPAGEFEDGETIRTMEMLGLVVDSPDAGGGRLLVRPF